ncbi:glycine/betaine ABC transporter substrate-binding protein [Paenalkalicoccus suaedae]|uniref:Glycine/betaine ABC transporter substrate-binding protein n=1 Tax=Paenalkalicoccus suaedae TaxID=2592382 RepID=A0A859FJW1_9BACI|nr:glycine betaine ABC transporter substrate-binding protein [Paenalkalicoccus suaedae]QKS73097.1 glycine/betaine ABC transporter substrate-binding protein [Paenalkalicoccus suaedae]
MKKAIGVVGLASVALLGACSSGDQVTVGAKNFTEQFILAKMTELLLEQEGYEVEMRDNLGSTALRQALENGQVDVTWDYTGTGLVTYNGEDPIADVDEAFARIQEVDGEQGITWTNISEVNNTYTLVMREDQANELGIESISDLSDYVNDNPGEFRMASDAEFANRPDGLPGVYETYGFEFGDAQVIEMNYGLNYDAIGNEEVEVAVGFSTDSRIPELNLINLEDDMDFFPAYSAAVSMTTEIYEEFPEMEEVFQRMADILDSEIMAELNYQVDIEQRNVDEVAEEFLQESGLLE